MHNKHKICTTNSYNKTQTLNHVFPYAFVHCIFWILYLNALVDVCNFGTFFEFVWWLYVVEF